jgi:hypothetical protein
MTSWHRSHRFVLVVLLVALHVAPAAAGSGKAVDAKDGRAKLIRQTLLGLATTGPVEGTGFAYGGWNDVEAHILTSILIDGFDLTTFETKPEGFEFAVTAKGLREGVKVKGVVRKGSVVVDVEAAPGADPSGQLGLPVFSRTSKHPDRVRAELSGKDLRVTYSWGHSPETTEASNVVTGKVERGADRVTKRMTKSRWFGRPGLREQALATGRELLRRGQTDGFRLGDRRVTLEGEGWSRLEHAFKAREHELAGERLTRLKEAPRGRR